MSSRKPPCLFLPSIVDGGHLSLCACEAGSNRSTWPRLPVGWRHCLCTLLRFPPASACRCVNALTNGTITFGRAAGRALFTCVASGLMWDKKKAELAASQRTYRFTKHITLKYQSLCDLNFCIMAQGDVVLILFYIYWVLKM